MRARYRKLQEPGSLGGQARDGIAKLLDEEAGAGVTATDTSVLMPRYASPEQIRGDRLTTATDVYSLGVVLYELLTFRCPYDVECTTRRAVALREQWLGTIDAETRQAMRDPITGIFESGGAMDEGRALGRTLLARDIEAVGSEGADAMDTWYLLVQYGTYDSDTAIGKLRGLPAWNRRERGDRHPQRFRSYTPWPTSMCRRGDWTRRRR